MWEYFYVYECDYRRILDSLSDLLDSLISECRHFTVHCYTDTLSSVHSHIFTSRHSVATSNGRRASSFGFPNYARPQLHVPVSHSNSSQRLNLSSSLSSSLTD
jgi:hypothetical protein